MDGNTNLTITGIDKYVVGQFAADIREKRKPEPYKARPPTPPQPACRGRCCRGSPPGRRGRVLALLRPTHCASSLTRSLPSSPSPPFCWLQGKGIRYVGEVITLKEGKRK